MSRPVDNCDNSYHSFAEARFEALSHISDLV
jgi:hypothetical protein